MADGSLCAAGTEVGNDSGAICTYTHTQTHTVSMFFLIFLDFFSLLFTFLYFLSSFLWNKVFIFSFYIF